MSRILQLALLSFWLIAVPQAALAQEAPAIDSIDQLASIIRWSGVVTSLFVIAGAWMLLRVVGGFVAGFSAQFSVRRLFMKKLQTIVQFIVFIATTIAVVTLSFQIDATVLAIIGGSVAVAVGFAVKDLVASFIAGIIIILDRPFQVGDRIEFGGYYGDITAIGLRSVRLQTLDDNTVTIPNSKFLSDISSSGNFGALDMQVVMDFHIGTDQDMDRACEIIREAALSSRYVFLAKPIVVLVTQTVLGNLLAVRLRLKAYVLDARHEKAFETDVNLRVLRAFSAAAILPPALMSPQQSMSSRANAAPNARRSTVS
ncbi:MAG TPA: mechanosensitive ion channel [Hyphomonadaceae bacterium]|nr:mechanosensitive ion channel [Hyphomonadaceae bacterium]HPN06244.1 mechanosensitive ion channel [Hyphomonadaceae bacterium]